ncbi:MAG: hypothetical protein ABIF40_03165 [archaeon]
MKKKGAVHVDWIISISIFIVFVLLLIILIQPSMTPVYDLSSLSEIVDARLDKNTKWEIEKTAIFLEGGTQMVNGIVSITDFFPFEKDPTSQNKYAIVDEINNEVDSIININSNIGSKDNIQFIGTPGNYYWLLYSADADFDHDGLPPAGDVFCYDVDDTLGVCEDKYVLGATETLEGFNFKALDDLQTLCNTDYEIIKTNFNYPENKEFSIYYVYTDDAVYDFTETIGLCNWDYNANPNRPHTEITPYEQANIFVKEYLYWILNEDGTTDSILVNIKVW